MEKTAVNWLIDEFVKIGILNAHILLKKQISTEDAINKAKEMEKQQIIALAAELYEDMFGIDGKEYAIDYYNKLKEL